THPAERYPVDPLRARQLPWTSKHLSRKPAMDAVLLISQHRTVEARMDLLCDATADADRAALLAEVGDHLTVHIASEEEIFYPAVHAARTEDILLGIAGRASLAETPAGRPDGA